MGHTVAAASTVLAAFLGGLAVGALAGARLAAPRGARSALRVYAGLEVFIAASALAVPVMLRAFDPVLAVAYADGRAGIWFGAARAAFSMLVVALPAAAMGATFPVVARWGVRQVEQTGGAAGLLYASNTAGAAVGAAAAALLLVPWFGLFRTTVTAAALNLAAALVAAVVAAVTPEESEGARAPATTQRPRAAATRAATHRGAVPIGRPGLASFAVAVTGWLALVNEVAWTRVLALVLGPTTYAFGVMLVVFIAGLAIGSAAVVPVADKLKRPVFALGLVMILVAAAPVVSMRWVEPLAMRVVDTMAASDARFATALGVQASTAGLLLLPIAIALGAAFPLALRVAAASAERVAQNVARVYAWNTAGAIAGALTAGFVLIPSFGLQRAIAAASAAGLLGAIGVLLASRSSLRRAALAAAAAAGVALFIWRAPRWDMELIASGGYKYARYVEGVDRAAVLRTGTLVYYREGSTATVAVRRAAGTLTLAIEGKVDASTGGDMLTQKLLAHLPLLLHSGPRRVAVVGLGSGVTAGAALAHAVERVDVIEISPEVVQAARYFGDANGGALADPRLRVIVGDGRSHLRLSRERYDVIISEPSNPWMAGIAPLFTHEFFEAARRRLARGGIFCQWTHTYDISAADLRSIVATFASVFPDATMWLVGESDLLLLGSTDDLVARIPGIRQRFRQDAVLADLRAVAVESPDLLLSTFVAGPDGVRTFASGADIQTDDRMPLEFSAPRAVFNREGSGNAAGLRLLAMGGPLPPNVREARTSAGARGLAARGAMLLRAEAYAPAFSAYADALALAPDDEGAIDGLVRAAAGAGRSGDARRILSDLASGGSAPVAARLALSRVLAAEGDAEMALDICAQAIAAAPDDPRGFEQAASIVADTGDAERLRDVLEQLRRWPDRPATEYYTAALALMEGRTADAAQVARDAIASGKADARMHNLLGAAAATEGRRAEARLAFEEATRQNARDPAAYVNLGLLELESGNAPAAARAFGEALLLDPSSASAREGLATARARLH